MGGTDERTNLVYVRGRVHFIAHAILSFAVIEKYQKRAKWCVICFSPKAEKREIKKKMKSRAIDGIRRAHAKNLSQMKWYTNNIESIRLFPDEEVPEMFKPGRAKLPKRGPMIYITDGQQTKRIHPDEEIPQGWRNGQKPSRLKQLAITGKNHKMGSGAGRTWVNNGVQNKYLKADTLIPEGWSKGRIAVGKFDPSKMGSNSKGESNPNHSGLTDTDILEHAIAFYKLHNHLNTNAWKAYAKANGIPINIVHSRFVEWGGGLNGLRRAVLARVS